MQTPLKLRTPITTLRQLATDSTHTCHTFTMDLVSKILENIMTVEDAESVDGKRETSISDQNKRQSISSGEQLEPDPPVQLIQSPQYSSFWYLDTDPMKAPNQFSEKLMEKVLSLIIGPETELSPGLEGRLEIHKTRPPFSVNLMATNSTQLGQKTGPVFELFDTVLAIVGWYNPFFTVGSLMLITHVILNPYLITTIPSAVILKKFLIPSYLKLYPPDPTLVDGLYTMNNPIPYEGPPLDKFEPPKVCSQYSREFLMNFADLQNYQVGYIRMYDALVDWGQHYFLFEDQKLTSVVYLGMLVLSIANLTLLPYAVPLLLEYFPFKFVSVASVWGLIGACHPAVKDKILDRILSEEARLSRLDRIDKVENTLMKLMATDVGLEDETREVEIFELHRLDLRNIWRQIGFTSTCYALSHPNRVLSNVDQEDEQDTEEKSKSFFDEDEDEEDNESHDRTFGAIDEFGPDSLIARKATLAEIKAPKNWMFSDELWGIDLYPMDWVNENCIMDLVSVDDDEKWVYDFVEGTSSPDENIYRRRRWVRECKRENIAARRRSEAQPKPASAPLQQSSEWLAKTFTNFSQASH